MSTHYNDRDASHRLALPPGFDLAGYRVERLLGKGGFGMTYLTRDMDLDMQVAVKELLPDGIATRADNSKVVAQTMALEDTFTWALNRFDEEARTLAKLNHPNIVRVHRLLRANGTAYMIMEYIEGQSLTQWIKSNPRPRENQVMDLLMPLIDGLEHLHQYNLLHLDVKPDNILIPPGIRGPVLLDFGSARVDTGRTQTLTAVVSEGYAPFEQYQTKTHPGPWTDIYALCAVMHHVLLGEKPPPATDRMTDDGRYPTLSQRLRGHYSDTLLRALDAGFAVRAKDRPATMAEFRGLLSGQRLPKAPTTLVGGGVGGNLQPLPMPVMGGQTVKIPPTQQQVEKNNRGTVMALLAVSAVCMLFAGIVGLFLLLRPNHEGTVANNGGSGSGSNGGSSAPVVTIGDSKEVIAAAMKEADGYFQNAEYARARDVYSKYAVNGGPPEAWLGVARSLLEMTRETDYRGSWREDPRILEAIAKAVESESTKAQAYLTWGLLLTERGTKNADHRLALDRLQTASAFNNTSAEYHMARGLALSQLEESDKSKAAYGLALTTVDQEIASKGETPYLLALKSGILERLGKFDESISVIDRAIARMPAVAHFHLIKSMILNWSKENEKAVASINRAIELDPDNPHYRIRRGRIYAAKLDYASADNEVTAAIQKDPNRANFYNWRGLFFFRNKDYRSAAREFGEAYRREPDSTLYLMNRGNSYQELNENADAVRDFSGVLKLDPDHRNARFNRMVLVHFDATTDAELHQVIADADILYGADASDWVPNRFKASALSRLGRHSEALALAAKDISLDPTSATPYSERAKIYDRMKNYDDAITDYNKAISIKPTAALYAKRGLCWDNKEDYTKAAADYSKAIELDDSVGVYFRDRAYCHYQLKDYNSAVADLNKAIELDPKDSPAYLYRGYVYLAYDNHSSAIEWFTRAIELNPQSKNAYKNRAASYRALGQIDKALADEATLRTLP